MSKFISGKSNFGNSTHIFDKVYTKNLTDGTNEIAVEDLGTGVKTWTAGTKYKTNQLVYVNEKLYICLVDHTAETNFATDLLAGNWKFIGNGVGSNVTQTVLFNTPTTSSVDASAVKLNFNESIEDYNYLIVKIKHSEDSIIQENYIYDCSNGEGTLRCSHNYQAINTSFTVVYSVNLEIKTNYADFYILSNTNCQPYIDSITGIKITELTTDYLAELSMPSDAYENITFTETATSYGYKTNTMTASNNGYISIDTKATESNADIRIYVNNRPMASRTLPESGWGGGLSSPIYAGSSYYIVTDRARTSDIRFYYSVGDAKSLGLI